MFNKLLGEFLAVVMLFMMTSPFFYVSYLILNRIVEALIYGH